VVFDEKYPNRFQYKDFQTSKYYEIGADGDLMKKSNDGSIITLFRKGM